MFNNKKPHKKHSQRSSVQPPFNPSEFINEPEPICTICSKEIRNISDGFISENGDGYSHFECVIKHLTQRYNIASPLKISYLGSGKFGVIEYIKYPNSFRIKQTIEWESPEAFKKMKQEVEKAKV